MAAADSGDLALFSTILHAVDACIEQELEVGGGGCAIPRCNAETSNGDDVSSRTTAGLRQGADQGFAVVPPRRPRDWGLSFVC